MNTIKRLQKWYISQCNGDWEHSNGVHLETLDNPGWHVKIDLCDTVLENIDFSIVEYGVGENSEPENNDWLHCEIQNNIFHGYGGPDKLEEIFEKFLDWSDKHIEQHL